MPMNRTRTFLSSSLALILLATGSGNTAAAQQAFSFEVTLDSFRASDSVFRVYVRNWSRGVSISSVELSVGNTDKNFDAAWSFYHPNVASHKVVTPDEDPGGEVRDDRFIVNFSGFDPNEFAYWYVDIDNNDSPSDPRRILFNNGDKTNAILSVTGSNGETVNITLPDGPAGQSSYVFRGGATRRNLNVESVVEAAVDPGGTPTKIYVDEASVIVNPGPGVVAATPTAPGIFNLAVYDGDVVRITAPQVAYRNFKGEELADSVLGDPAQIQDLAEERFTARGISVNNLAPTGDPTLYEFDVQEDTVAVVKWRHDYALRIESDFSETDSTDVDANGDPWAGPLTSQANGNPMPAAGTVHWIERDTPVVATLESTYVDAFRHPGQNIRFVPYAYIVAGASNTSTNKATDDAVRATATLANGLLSARQNAPNQEYQASVNGKNEILRKREAFVVGQSPEPEHQLESFTMYGPAEIRYIWKIQYGVEVAVDEPSHQALPKLNTPSDTMERTGAGVFWFDQDVAVSVASASKESTLPDAKSLTGWIAGDGYFFSSRGEIDGASGALTLGTPQSVGGNPVAVWDPTGMPGYRAMNIPRLRRPAKVLWTYGSGVVRTEVTVGEYVFQHDPALAGIFRTKPTVRSVPAPSNQNLTDQGVWDPEAAKFYPLAGGAGGGTNVFRVDWVPAGGTVPVEVEILVKWPTPAHYPHVAGTPAVALDPDPDDDFLFKELKYTESSASIDSLKQFSAPSQGRSVLLFSNIQRNGRGQPKEFLQVRVVETMTLEASILNAATPVSVVIGDKIRDRMLDRAQLGTGYVVNSDNVANPTRARYNPFVYDPAKLVGLAAKDVYDTALLFSDAGQKRVANKGALPGPVIPVNLFPNPGANDLLRVIWYDDPAQNDNLLWPHAGRVYAPRWPVAQGFADTALASANDGGTDAVGRVLDKLAGTSSVVIDQQLAYVTSATDNALTILDVGDPSAFRLVAVAAAGFGDFTKLGGATEVVVDAGLAVVAARNDSAVTLVDVSNPVLPRKISVIQDGVGDFAKLAGASSLALRGDLLFVGAPTDNAITIVDISDPTQPQFLATIEDGSGAFTGLAAVNALAVEGDVLFATSSTDGALTLVDISDPGAPIHLATVTGITGASDVVVEGGHAFVARGSGIAILGIGDPRAPVSVSTAPAAHAVTRLALDGDLLYAASSTGSSVHNVGDRGSPFAVRNFGRGATSLAVADGLMLVTGAATNLTAHLAAYAVVGDRLGRIVIATQWGSESEDNAGRDQVVAPASGAFPRTTIFNPTRLQQAQVYNQPDRAAAGYNPNEEHALMAPSLRYAQVSPRPLAAYALRDNDLNLYPGSRFPGNVRTGPEETSHPYVLVQYFDVAEGEFKMNVYTVQKEQADATGAAFEANYKFAAIPASPTVNQLKVQPFVRMEAGEPVIPFYPIGFVDGAVPCPNTYGTDLRSQKTYWEDHRGSNWAVSGGDEAWFSVSPHYRMSPNFWWPKNAQGNPKSGRVTEATKSIVNVNFPGYQMIPFEVITQSAAGVGTGDCVPFLPADATTLLALPDGAPVKTVAATMLDSVQVVVGIGIFGFSYTVPVPATLGASLNTTTPAATATLPTRILYKSDWPDVVPVLKAGETLTFSGGEFRADNPQMVISDFEGNLRTIDTPGLPQLTAFASAEVVFDALNPDGSDAGWKSSWSARVGQVLDVRRLSLKVEDFPPVLQPANGKTRVSGGQYIFVDLPASLQKRVRYNPLAQFVDSAGITRTGALEITGLLNDKDIGNPTLTAAPPAVYVLEPNILTEEDVVALKALDGVANSSWDAKIDALATLTRNPNGLTAAAGTSPFWVGLEGKVSRNTVTGEPNREPIEAGSTVTVPIKNKGVGAPERAFGPGLALIPNGDFMNPTGKLPGTSKPYPDVSYVTVVENNDPSLGGSPITPHVIKIDRRERYRGSIKTVESDNVFDENLVLRHTGDFGTNADDLFFEWWYRPDDGSLNVQPPDLIPSGQTNPWRVFPDDSGKRGQGRFGITLKGNPNAPEVLIADTFWFVRYRHKNELPDGTNWNKHEVVDGSTKTPVNKRINFTWAGAGNSQPFEDFDLDGFMDFRAQLAQGWIKRVLDAVNPYEARIRNFDGDNPATVTSMLQQFGPRFEGPVALNPAKNVIENVGLIELYETILKRGRDLTIDLSRPVASPAIANALQLASTRISDFYTVLGNEAYVDSLDPTIGIEGGSISNSTFSFQNQVSDLLEEELGMLRGVDDFFARPVYNRMFWNFTKGEGEAAYALNYNISDINQDGFVNEDDAMILYPQGHGDAWGHYLTALRNQYELLKHPFFNWVSRSEFYNLQDIVIKVDFLDERKFAQTAAAKAKVGAEIVNQTYRDRYVDDPEAQWQGYTDSNPDRAWGVQGWARRAGQGAYFDWVTANALLPAEHPNETLEGIQKVQRSTNADIKVISANLNGIQRTFDSANQGNNPLGLPRDAVIFDIDPFYNGVSWERRTHFEQIYDRAVRAMASAKAVWDNANEDRNRLREIANSELEFRNSTFQEDLSYKNRLIKIFGKPYQGTVGPGQLYPAGYDGPDLGLYMYVNVREVTRQTVPGPTTAFAGFGDDGKLNSGLLNDALAGVSNRAVAGIEDNDITDILDEGYAGIFAPTFANASNALNYDDTSNGLFSVDYTDLESPKVNLVGFQQSLPIKAAGYTFQAPKAWGARPSTGDLQILINQMVQQEAAIAGAIGAWDSLQGAIVREAQLINARLDSTGSIRQRNKEFQATKFVFDSIIKALETAKSIADLSEEVVVGTISASEKTIPLNLPTGGLAVSPGDALFALRGGFALSSNITKSTFDGVQAALNITKLIEELAFSAAELGVNFENDNDALTLSKKEWLKSLEDLVGDEPIKRIAVFKEIENLRQLSDQYRTLLDEGSRLVEERQAFNKRVAAQTQRKRYQDFTFRISRNHALQTYRDAHDLAARYAYLAGKAYDYETNFAPGDPGSPSGVLADIVATRGLGNFSDGPQAGAGGLSEALAWLKTNFDSQRGELGINNPQLETGKMSLRSEMLRILPSDTGGPADAAWKQALQKAYVDDLWLVPEFRHYCRAFTSESDAAGVHVPQPGLVLRFGTGIIAGQNFFGHPLGGGDHAYDASNYATKILGTGVWFSDYASEDLFNDLSAAPRVYLVPAGTDIMTIPTAGASSTNGDPLFQRLWNVVDASIPVPIPATQADLDSGRWVPALDGLNGGMGQIRKISSFRAYHNGGDAIDDDELVFDSRLVSRSVWNTEWILIVPGLVLNADPAEGLRRFTDQVSDIKLVFQTYGYRGG